MPELVFTNARLVLSDAVVDGTVSVAGGIIRSVDDAPSALAAALDLDGDYLLPGLVEIHTDNLEKHLQPRPGVMWPSSRAALFGHDAQVAAAGITTVLDSISMGEYAKNSNRRQMIATAFEAIADPAVRALTRAEHHLHLRCEITDPAVVELYEPLSADPLVALVSLMDHTPRQRQWADLDRFRTFHREKKWTDDEFAMNVANRQAAQAENAEPNRRRILEIARANGTVLASHDDTTLGHVDEAVADGITISEFPTTLEAAQAARSHGMKTVMGAPNVVRGGSHSGNVSAADLAAHGLLDGLSSDYVPASLLEGAFKLHVEGGIALPQAIALVSDHPAAMLGLADRGRIEAGRRADLVRVRLLGGLPVVIGVWREGRQVN